MNTRGPPRTVVSFDGRRALLVAVVHYAAIVVFEDACSSRREAVDVRQVTVLEVHGRPPPMTEQRWDFMRRYWPEPADDAPPTER